MEHAVRMEIGGVGFAVTHPDRVILDEPGPVYGPFFADTHAGFEALSPVIQIRLQIGDVPPIGNLERIFDSGRSWTMFQDGSDFCLALNPPAWPSPIWFTRVNREFTEATLYCSHEMVTEKTGKATLPNPVSYPLDQILLMHILAQNQGVLLHAAGVAMDGKGYLFLGRSGAGKSTIAGLLAAHGDVQPLSDDRVVVREINGSFKAYGTPWPGEAMMFTNTSVPLSGIFFLHHEPENRIRTVEPREALKKILPVASIPWYHREMMTGMLGFSSQLGRTVSCYDLGFVPDASMVDFMRRVIQANPGGPKAKST